MDDTPIGDTSDELNCADAASLSSEGSIRRKYPCMCYVWVGCAISLLLGLTVAIVTLQVIYFTSDDVSGQQVALTTGQVPVPGPTSQPPPTNDNNGQLYPSLVIPPAEANGDFSDSRHEAAPQTHVPDIAGVKTIFTTPKQQNMDTNENILPSASQTKSAKSSGKKEMQNILTWLLVTLFLVGFVLVVCTVFTAKGLCPNKRFSSLEYCDVRLSRRSEDNSHARTSQVTEEIQMDDLGSPDHRSTNHDRQNNSEVSMATEGQDLVTVEISLNCPPPYSIAVSLPTPDIYIIPSIAQPANSPPDVTGRPSSLPTYEEALASGAPLPQ